ncbi:MAG: hypothetical protein QHH04_09185 [Methanolinea sp.]|jgi:hypothetical protein|nr:hypothetical protein [Methanolinea sp.]
MEGGEIARALSLLSFPGSVVEVRAITERGMASGYFDDPAALGAAVGPLDAAGTAGIYVTLNEVNPALLSRRANRIKMHLSQKDATTADGDILRRRWFPVDIDPVRPSGVSATDGEHRAALDRAGRIAAFLSDRGWPAPVLADSGNGAHLLYRIDLPNDDAARDLVKRALEALDVMFSDGACTVDTANHNAARIWKLYGTTSRKGDCTPDRPHRKARILDAPEQIGIAGRGLLEDLAASLPAPPAPRAPPARGTTDLRSWLSGHGIGIAAEKPYAGGTLFVLDECPFSDAHRDGAFAIQFGNGAIHAGCHHASCGGGAQRWKELRAKFGQGEDPAPAEPPAVPVPGDPAPPADLSGHAEALSLLQHGDPKEAMLRAFALDHEGDEVVAECLVMSLASRSVANTNGLHVSVTGESGKGKSHAFATMLRQVPERFRLEGAMSNKALFYLEGMQPGSVIVLDDHALSEEIQEILKSATTCFSEPIGYRTVTRDRKMQVCTIPERCVWWVSKVEGVGDDQVQNRMLTCWIDDSEEQDARVLARILARDQGVPGCKGGVRPEIHACREMWEEIGRQRFHVVIPFATRIRFQAAANRRNPEMLLDLIKANAVLRFMQREQQQHGPVSCLTATIGDFEEAARLYSLLSGTAGGQETKLTRREAGLLLAIVQGEWPEFTIPMLQKVTGWSNGNIHKIIHGYVSRGTVHSGLLEKCPAIAYCDRTVATAEDANGVSMQRRMRAYTFDRDLYAAWFTGGAVWLDEDDDGGSPQTSAPSADFRNTSAGAEVSGNNEEGSDSLNNEYNKSTYICTRDHFRICPGSRKPVEDTACVSARVCDPEIAEVQKSKNDESPPIVANVPEISPFALPQTLPQPKIAEVWGSLPGYGGSPGDPTGTPSVRIDARDYKPLEPPEKTPCFLCGAPWSFYVEKPSGDRLQRKDRAARRICRACYGRAKRDVQEHAEILPGTCDPSRMEPLASDAGRCTVCSLDPAAYIDRATRTKVCESCYRRLSRKQGCGEATA